MKHHADRATDRSSEPRDRRAAGWGALALFLVLTIVVASAWMWLFADPGRQDAHVGPSLDLIDPGQATPSDESADVNAADTVEASPLPLEGGSTDTEAPRSASEAGNDERKSGTIVGSVLIPESLRGRVGIWTLELAEARNDVGARVAREARRWKRRFEVAAAAGIARFRVDDVPFSSYGWNVAASSLEPPSASESTLVLVDEGRPHAEVVLALVPAPTLHATIKDQEMQALRGVRVTMRPIGFPEGRSIATSESDVYGLAILPGLAVGEYELLVGPVARPIVPAQRIVVDKRELQSAVVTIPKGGNVSLLLATPAGGGIGEAEIVAIAKDSKVYKKYEARTDGGGRAKLEHLPPGAYYLHLTKTGFERRFEKIVVTENETLEKRVTMHWDFRQRR